MDSYKHIGLMFCCIVLILISCKNKKEDQNRDSISTMDLKRGEVVSCGPQNGQFGKTSFLATIPEKLRPAFNIAVALLYSFEYDESEKMFAKVIDQAPDCAMAYWGVAMSNFHPLWAPPSPAELEKGEKAVNIARSINKKTKRESDYIEAIGKFYENNGEVDHRSRVLNFEKAMEKIYLAYPADKEAPVFYALALNAAADPADKTYTRQKKAFSILNGMFQKEPLHPGIAHYIIHNFDYPGLAEMALPAARKYASIAPASAHAQHMPSHIFTRLGLWDECITSNLVAAASARCYAEQAKIKGHWDEELHVLDYLVYAYLQKGEDGLAKERINHLRTIDRVDPVNFKVLYAFAASPARYFLEKRMWKEAASLELQPGFPWEKFPWQKAIVHFTRLLGAVHEGKINSAKKELEIVKSLHAALSKQKNMTRETAQVVVQINTSEAWIQYKEGNYDTAIQLMTVAAAMEDATEKHSVTPGEIIPARELLGDMLLEMNKPALALEAYRAVLETHPNRFNGLYSAGIAAQRNGNKEEAKRYFQKLLHSIGASGTKRSEIQNSRAYLNSN
ncbi:MAG: tetratricopeptide repeat protein [Ferruginibacter sp.]|nr:tetratricopeptide repeat protein [Chitinophagaceae bacterium]